MTVLLCLAGVAVLVVVWAEVLHWRSSRKLTNPDRGGTEAVVVLGYRNNGNERANALNRWRVRAGLRSIDPKAPSSRLVFSGGPHEAGLMARYEKARLYLRLQRPDLAPRMVRAADYRVGEWAPLKPLFAAYGLLDLAKTRRNLAK